MGHNHGQICQSGNTKDIIGKWATCSKAEVCNGGKYIDICKRQDLTYTNTFIRPEIGKRGKPATWHSECGIDDRGRCCAISSKSGNRTARIKNIRNK